MTKPFFLAALLGLPACATDLAGDIVAGSDGGEATDSQAAAGADSQTVTGADTPTAAELWKDCFDDRNFGPDVVHEPGSPQFEDHLAFLNLIKDSMITHSAV